jgi:hypothetical protein
MHLKATEYRARGSWNVLSNVLSVAAFKIQLAKVIIGVGSQRKPIHVYLPLANLLP